MKIVFRLNFHTEFGQTIWLKLAVFPAKSDVRIEQTLPLRWINDRQWEADIEVSGGPLRLEYAYQFRQEGNGVLLDEWNGPRTAEADPAADNNTAEGKAQNRRVAVNILVSKGLDGL